MLELGGLLLLGDPGAVGQVGIKYICARNRAWLFTPALGKLVRHVQEKILRPFKSVSLSLNISPLTVTKEDRTKLVE